MEGKAVLFKRFADIDVFDLEIDASDPDDIVTYLGESWRRGRGQVDDAVRPAVAVRMGLRYVRNLGEREITTIEAARILGINRSTLDRKLERYGIQVPTDTAKEG